MEYIFVQCADLISQETDVQIQLAVDIFITAQLFALCAETNQIFIWIAITSIAILLMMKNILKCLGFFKLLSTVPAKITFIFIKYSVALAFSLICAVSVCNISD